MKKILTGVSIIFFTIICACSNNVLNPPAPPAPKPDNNYDITAVAAKKADYYARLFFDLADGYLSDDNVAKVRFGGDGKYVESLNFSNANTTGEIHSTALGSFDFYYESNTGEGESTLKRINDYTLAGYTSNVQRRKSVVDRATAGAWKAARIMNINFKNTDITGESFSLALNYAVQGYDTSKGASISGTISFDVLDSSGTRNTFTITYNLNGALWGAGEGYAPSTRYNFIINSGNITVQGTGALAAYKIYLTYSNDKGEGSFTVSTTTYAAYTVSKTEAYYVKDGDLPGQKRYVLWDYPL
ncbi:MAG: hypothetical protein FWD54_00540 [Endomicrobia bacterium]|nr:hypothetical protein [Endomicrobiia bacterium]MCL2798760.1 hypothetical protein [Endomicrobiia bacterium]